MKTFLVGVLNIPIWLQSFSDYFSGKNFTPKTLYSPKSILSFQVRHRSHNNILDFSCIIKTYAYFTYMESLNCDYEYK